MSRLGALSSLLAKMDERFPIPSFAQVAALGSIYRVHSGQEATQDMLQRFLVRIDLRRALIKRVEALLRDEATNG